MRIRELYIENFGKLSDYRVRFSEGVNLLYGGNEAGKTTVFNFIVVMLYGISASSRKTLELNLRKRYLPWGKNKMGGTLTFEDGNSVYTVERSFGSAKAQDKLNVTNITSGEALALPGGKEVGEYFLDLSEEAFKGTLFIGTLPRSGVCGNDSVITKLSNLSSYGESEYSFDDVKKRLKDASNIIERKTKTGKIQPLIEEQERLRNENRTLYALLDESKRLTERNEWLKSEDNRLTERRKAIENTLSRQRGLSLARDYLNAVKRKNKLSELLRESEDKKREITRNDFSADKSYVQGLKNLISKRDGARLEFDRETIRLENEERNFERICKMRPDKSNIKPLCFISVISLILSLILLAGLALHKISGSVAVFSAIAAGILFVIFLLSLAMALSKTKNNRIALSNFEDEAEAAKKALDEIRISVKAAEKNYEEAESEFKTQFKLFFFSEDYGAASDYIELLDRKLQDYSESKLRYEAMLEGAPTDEEIDALRDRAKGADADFSDSAEPLSDAEILKLESEKNQIVFEMSEIQKELAVNGEKVKGLADAEERISENERAISDIEKKISKYKYEKECIEISIDGLETAQNEMRKNFAPLVNKYASEILSEITGGKYSQLTVSNTLETMIIDTVTNAAREDKFMSAGTLEQIYFALRLAVIKCIFENKADTVVILDDAFLNFDDERMKAAAHYVSNALSKNTQVLFFTCRNAERAGFSDCNVIEI